MNTNSYFVSDLHLFSRRSLAWKLEDTFRNAIQQAHTFVLGGDIFDFRWSTQLSLGHAVSDSIEWLQRLMAHNPECNFHYLLGNHDCHPEFVGALSQLEQDSSQFVWHRHLLRIGEVVYLHGDIVDTRVRHGQNYHEVLDAKRLAGDLRAPPTALSHAIYDAAVKARMHRLVVQLAKPKDLVLRRLSRYLESQQLDASTGVSEVYFGHTHRRLNAVPYRDIRYHNPGAAIKGLPFHLIQTNVPALSLANWKTPTANDYR
jgi:UDP-2,3-diacylglucosamine hydrolase